MQNIVPLSLLVFNSFFIFGADTSDLHTNDAFLLWCGVLAAKETKREQVTGITPRQFLGIDEKNINMKFHYTPHGSRIADTIISPKETVAIAPTSGIHDRRLGNRWRRLDDKNLTSLINDKTEFALCFDPCGRYHSVEFATHSCCNNEHDDKDQGEAFQLHPNSIPYEDFYLYGGICSHKNGNVWVAANPVSMVLAKTDTDAQRFPLRIMWVEKFKKPIIMREFMLPAKKYYTVLKTVTIKFIEDTFQVYYDASGVTKEDEYAQEEETVEPATSSNPNSSCTITASRLTYRNDTPSLKVVNYTLDRVKKQILNIPINVLSSWHKIYSRMQNNALTNDELETTRTEVCKIIDQLEK